jgi:putative ABC transport system permease protein
MIGARTRISARTKALTQVALSRWKEQPGRLVLSFFAVALGVALGLSIHLVNRSALAEFSDAIALVNGQAQRQVIASGGFFDDRVFDEVATLPGISLSSPVIETNAELTTNEGKKVKLTMLGIDLFRAAAITPELVIIADALRENDNLGGFSSDQIFLSTAALDLTKSAVGQEIFVTISAIKHRFIVAGRLSQVPAGQAVATMDIANLQWRFSSDTVPGWRNRLSRIDIKLDDLADKDATEKRLEAALPKTLMLVSPNANTQRMSNVSRAYRVNLAVLGMVALVVGGFLVFSTMTLLAQRQIGDAAILSLLGLEPLDIRRFILSQGLAIGVVGSLIGLAAGVGLAQAFLSLLGGDLGGGYFNGSTPRLRYAVLDLAGFALLGIGTSVAAAWPCATQLMNNTVNPTAVLSGGSLALTSDEPAPSITKTAVITFALSLAAFGLLQLPAILNLPIGGFAAMAVVLLAGISLVPFLTQRAAIAIGKLHGRLNLWRYPSIWLASQRLSRYPKTISAALSGIVASVALASAMAIMVHSFRESVNAWLFSILPADVYVRSSANLNPSDQAAIREIPGIARADFLKATEVLMRNDLPKVAIIGRSFQGKPIQEMLPLIDTAKSPPYFANPTESPLIVYGSEAMADLYGWQAGTIVRSPMGGKDWFIGGIWRDYGRQHGSVVMDLSSLANLTGNANASDIALWLETPDSSEKVIASVKTYPGLADAEARSSEAIRAVSLKIFDRSFALTYVIEAIAILVALFGVASTFAGESLSRLKEFATLTHLGAPSSTASKQLVAEATLAISLAVAWGALIGLVLAWILVRRINPHSFHWSMDFAWPWELLSISAISLVVLGVASALLAYRSSLNLSPVVAIKG